MKCLSPVTIRNPVYGKSLSVHGEMPMKYIQVPCGHCAACLANKRQDWIFRLSQQFSVSHNCYFITLTYNDEHLPLTDRGHPTLVKKDFQDYMKRFRDRLCDHPLRWYNRHHLPLPDEYRAMKYFACGEYGDTFQRPHYHFIIFNCPLQGKQLYNAIFDSWQHGFIRYDNLTGARIGYVTKYSLKQYDDKPEDCEPPFFLCSKGMGVSFLTKYDSIDYIIKNGKNSISTPDGVFRIPRYISDKILSGLDDHIVNQYKMTLQKRGIAYSVDYENRLRQKYGCVDEKLDEYKRSYILHQEKRKKL